MDSPKFMRRFKEQSYRRSFFNLRTNLRTSPVHAFFDHFKNCVKKTSVKKLGGTEKNCIFWFQFLGARKKCSKFLFLFSFLDTKKKQTIFSNFFSRLLSPLSEAFLVYLLKSIFVMQKVSTGCQSEYFF